MPEGDTLYRTAVTLRKALLGRTITRFQTSRGDVAAIDSRLPVAGRRVSAVEARGKHLLITFSPPAPEPSTPSPQPTHSLTSPVPQPSTLNPQPASHPYTHTSTPSSGP